MTDHYADLVAFATAFAHDYVPNSTELARYRAQARKALAKIEAAKAENMTAFPWGGRLSPLGTL
jgi:hypothetical protein